MKAMPATPRSFEVHVGDAALADRIARAAEGALRTARIAVDEAAAATRALPVVRLRTRRRFEALGAARIAGAIVVMRVTEKSARRLPALVDDVRAAGAAGVQIVWDGESPPRELVEEHVFAALEKARATPKGPPVVLAKSEEPARALRVLISGKRKEPLG